jgi:chromosomal replication initiation ATPase DnaA
VSDIDDIDIEHAELNVWDQVLSRLRDELDSEEFRRWFSTTAYASDSGDHVTVWVLSEPIRRHLTVAYQEPVRRALRALGRGDVEVRFVVSGFDESEDE